MRESGGVSRAVEAVAGSSLFDPDWYAAQVGASFDSRRETVEHYVAQSATGSATPHPLFEPTWVYPAGRWRDRAPDPLSHYLSRPDRAGLATHPLLPSDAERWVKTATPDTELPKTVGRPVTYRQVVDAAYASLEAGTAAYDGAAHHSASTGPISPSAAEPELSVILIAEDDFRRTLRWLRHLVRTEARAGTALELLVVTSDPAVRRLATTTGLSLPGTRVVPLPDPRGRVTVEIDPELEPPAWRWLHHLVARLAKPGVGPSDTVGPLIVTEDQTIVAAAALPGSPGLPGLPGIAEPFLAGETPADAERMAHLPVPALWPGVVAYRTPQRGPFCPTGTRRATGARRTSSPPDVIGSDRDDVLAAAYVVPAARVMSRHPIPIRPQPSRADTAAGSPGAPGALWRAAGFEGPGRPLRIVEGRPALRWAIDIAAPLAPRGRRWGDDPFARSLAAALERLDQRVTVDHPETRSRASRDHDDVVLVIRGLDPVAPTPPQNTDADDGVATQMMWVISHPDEVTAAECAAYDVVLAASPVWAQQRSRDWASDLSGPIQTLLQCTDTTRFHPGLAEPDTGPEVLFVGNSRGHARPVVANALAAGVDLSLYGDGWTELVDPVLAAATAARLAAIHVPNDQLGHLYASAGVVLGDHWDDMRTHGFVANRVFDVLACGARLFSDDAAGLDELLTELYGRPAPRWDRREDFALLGETGWRDRFPDADQREMAAHRVVAEHSFDARAAALLDIACTRAAAT